MSSPLPRPEVLAAASADFEESARIAALQRLCILDTPPEDDYDDLTRLAAFICNTPIALISLVDEQRQWFKSSIGMDVTETPRAVSFCTHALRQRQLFIVPDARQDERFTRNPFVVQEPGIRFYAGMPIAGPEGHNLGTLCVIDHRPRALSEECCVALRVLARQAGALFQIRHQIGSLRSAAEEQVRIEHRLRESQERLREANRRLEQMVRTDALTGLGNRRLFNERMRQEWKLAQRLEFPLALLMIDVDYFKKVNDEQGHSAGDDVLRHLAGLLEHSTRESDTCVRYGGEEFAVILPATTQNQAEHLADVLREEIAVAPCGHQNVTVSIGVAACHAGHAADTPEQLIQRADAALYAAKSAGRNRVECAPPDSLTA
ncbi:MAG TPA: sensor domain-containing diguanylate cyclase [Acidobacteriaceae bacterium]|nr:sensor domain-containing diguanylate cyclase [Acidobacteriaceae bacterium]